MNQLTNWRRFTCSNNHRLEQTPLNLGIFENSRKIGSKFLIVMSPQLRIQKGPCEAKLCCSATGMMAQSSRGNFIFER